MNYDKSSLDIKSLKDEIAQAIKTEIMSVFDSKKAEIESKIAELKKAVEEIMNEIIYIKNELKEIITSRYNNRIDYKTKSIEAHKTKYEAKHVEELEKKFEESSDEDLIICD